MSIPGHKDVHWRKDPEILARLVKVEDLHLMGINNFQIAQALKVDPKTITNDLRRLQQLWHERFGAEIEQRKERAVASYRKVQKAAWTEFQSVKDTSLNKSAYLNTVKSAEDSIAKVLGIEAPVKIAPTDPSGENEYANTAIDKLTSILAGIAARSGATGSAEQTDGERAARLTE